MAGNANSGRKSLNREAKEEKLRDISIQWILKNFKTLDDKTKLKISLTIASKIMPQTQNINQTIEEKNDQEADNIYEALRRRDSEMEN